MLRVNSTWAPGVIHLPKEQPAIAKTICIRTSHGAWRRLAAKSTCVSSAICRCKERIKHRQCLATAMRTSSTVTATMKMAMQMAASCRLRLHRKWPVPCSYGSRLGAPFLSLGASRREPHRRPLTLVTGLVPSQHRCRSCSIDRHSHICSLHRVAPSCSAISL